MILPLRTNIVPRRTPYANYFFIAANAVIFLLTFNMGTGHNRPVADAFMLWPSHPEVWQFVSYAFLHGSWMHIIGNMFFLYLFGNNVNDELGNVGYACFYLAGAVFSALGHSLIHTGSPIPILGASGAVAAVTGAYLVLYPQTLITVLIFFIIIDTWEIAALWFIGFKMIVWDNVVGRFTANVAYDAHLAGYAYGILVSIFLLWTKLISSTGVDLWTMIRQWNRRRVYKDSVASGYDPFEGRHVKQVSSKEVKTPPTAQEQKIMDLRAKIQDLVSQRDMSGAIRYYLELVNVDPDQVLPRQPLLDIANQLMANGMWKEAADAYESFLEHYYNYEYSEQVELMLGILYSRYLKNPEKAKVYLNKALEHLHDANQVKMARLEFEKL
jgi:membrane associated rhomboid family serine protease